MVRTYFNQAFHLIRQNPLFSGFYILGTGLAISMVMLLVVIYYIGTFIKYYKISQLIHTQSIAN